MPRATTQQPNERPVVVGIGGSSRAGSSTDQALRLALRAAEGHGARTTFLGGAFLARLPLYAPEEVERTPEAARLIEAVRGADGLIVASPGYHGGVSGLVKNALDFLEDLRDDERPYLDGRSVGCVVTAFGWQACTSTLVGLRSIVHALRGWPTPLGVTLNTRATVFDAAGACADEGTALRLRTVARQVVEFADGRAARHERPLAVEGVA